jgi:NAD(P)-dependent dehydrogenase (short-subunit alcohol dehydrogenase family)
LQDAARSIDPTVITAVQCDVTSPESISEAVKTIEQETSYIDVLINNAGITGPTLSKHREAQSIQELQSMMQRDWHLWNPTWETNTAAVIAVGSAFLSLLDAGNRRRGWVQGRRETQKKISGDDSDLRTSQIITVTSIAAFNREPTAGMAYLASKAGSTALGKSLAYLLAPWGIRSNVIAPGRKSKGCHQNNSSEMIKTPGFPSEMTAGSATTFPVNTLPAGKPGQYEDIAAAIIYLIGKSGAYINGNVQVIDGGRLSVMPGMY